MATKNYTKTITTWENEKCYIVTWNLANGDDGQPLEIPSYVDRSVQVTGTFGAGGTVVFEGSNDGTTANVGADGNYVTLSDPQGTALSRTSAGLKQIEEVTRWFRPRCTAGDGTTALVITLLLRRP